MKFDFNKNWNELSKEEKDNWEKLVEKVEAHAKRNIILKGRIPEDYVGNNGLSPEDEWDELKVNYENMYRKGSKIDFKTWVKSSEDNIVNDIVNWYEESDRQ